MFIAGRTACTERSRC